MQLGPFYVDEDNSDDQYLYVDVAGRGTVVIKVSPEGIGTDIYPLHVVDESVASTWATMAELTREEDEPKAQG